MKLTYLNFHLFFTAPLAVLLGRIVRPMSSSRDTFRIIFLSTLAVIYTFPWDRYVIIHKAWGYPDWSVLFTIGKVPAEEIAYFVMQSIITSRIYTLFTIPIIPSLYLLPKPDSFEANQPLLWNTLRWSPTPILLSLSYYAYTQIETGTHRFYISTLSAWALPVIALLWSISGDHAMRRYRSVLLSIILPTLYLSITDTVAIRNGTWFIYKHTTLDVYVWSDLPIEEALFFLATNILLVLGLTSFEKFEAIIDTWPELFSPSKSTDSYYVNKISKLLKSMIISINLTKTLKNTRRPILSNRIEYLSRTLEILKEASKSFYSASFIFSNYENIRSKFIILYGFCRETDDLIDHSKDKNQAKKIVKISRDYLDLLWSFPKDVESDRLIEQEKSIENFINKNVPNQSKSVFMIFSDLRSILSKSPIEELMKGYEFDSIEESSKNVIKNEEDLIEYCRWVAGSVGEMCVEIIWSIDEYSNLNLKNNEDESHRRKLILTSANDMGVALQLINIARDIREDSKLGRVYIPKNWFESNFINGLDLKHYEILKSCSCSDSNSNSNKQIDKLLDQVPFHLLAEKLIDLAFIFYHRSFDSIFLLPKSFHGPIRASITVYLEIGQKIKQQLNLQSHSNTSSSSLDGADKSLIDDQSDSTDSLNKKEKLNQVCNNDCKWKGERIFLTQFQRFIIVVKEMWGLNKRL